MPFGLFFNPREGPVSVQILGDIWRDFNLFTIQKYPPARCSCYELLNGV